MTSLEASGRSPDVPLHPTWEWAARQPAVGEHETSSSYPSGSTRGGARLASRAPQRNAAFITWLCQGYWERRFAEQQEHLSSKSWQRYFA